MGFDQKVKKKSKTYEDFTWTWQRHKRKLNMVSQ